MGIEILVIIPVMFSLIYSQSFYVLSTYSGTIRITSPVSTFSPGMIVTIAAAFISMPLNVLFGYFNIKIGNYYGVPTLRRAGKAGIAVSIISLIIIPLQFGVPGLILYIPSSPSYSTILFLWLLLILVWALVGLEYIIMMYRGLGGMREKTGIEGFETAKTLWLVGLFIYVTMPIAMILYGNALRKLNQRKQVSVADQGVRRPLEVEVNYCSRCGAKIEPGARFCSTCGSPIRYGKE
jgi:hypothetical protein